jgi:hypothetical protein
VALEREWELVFLLPKQVQMPQERRQERKLRALVLQWPQPASLEPSLARRPATLVQESPLGPVKLPWQPSVFPNH